MAQAALETVRSIFGSQGQSLSNEATFASMIIGNTKSTLFSILGNAQQICRASKRQRLTVNDLNLALESLDMQPLFGYNSGEEPELVEVTEQGPPRIYAYRESFVQIEQNNRKEIPPYPLQTHDEIQWICVNGAVHENTETSEIVTEKTDSNQIKANQQSQQPQDSDAYIVSSKHQFSYTHQKFFRESRVKLLSGDKEEMEKMFYRLSHLDCISTLVPYFIRFSLIQFRDHQNDWNTLYASLCTARALVQNTNLKHIDCYLQSFITIGLSFLLCPTILKKNALEFIKIAGLSAEFLYVIAEKLKDIYPMVQPRITDQLLSVLLNRESSVNEKFGAFSGLAAFGSETVTSFILPNVGEIINDLIQGPMRSGDRDTRLIASTMYDSILNSVGLCLHSDTAKSYNNRTLKMSPKTYNDREKILDLFGSQLLQFYIDQSVEFNL